MSGLIDRHISDFALLVRVHEFGGFTAAARALGRPQGTISRRISLLEKQLKVRLLDRTTRHVALTEAGRRVYELARAMLDEAEAIEVATESLLSEPRGNLRIVAPVVFGQAFVADAAVEFMTLFPKVAVKLELISRNLDIVEEGFDVAIHIGRLRNSSLARTPLGVVRTGLFAAPSYLKKSRKINHPKDLQDHQVLNLGFSLSAGKFMFRNAHVTESVSPPKRMTSNDVQSLLAAANMGIGIAVLPTFTGALSVAQRTLVEVLPEWQMPEFGVSAITPSTRGVLPSVRQFLDLLKVRLLAGTKSQRAVRSADFG